MTVSRFRYLLFDLGGTLMHDRADWLPILAHADEALAHKLKENDIELDTVIFRNRLHAYYEQRDKDFRETTYHFVLHELLSELGYADVAESVLRSALDALYSVTQENWSLEDDTITTLQKLKTQDYNLGILSNAGDDKDVQELIERFGIRGFFDFVLTSAACFYRKPHPRSFEIALAHWNIPPIEAIMIGDSLEADIHGAKQLGMKTIWITRRAKFSEDEMRRVTPDFSVRKLSELLPTLDRISITSI